MGHLSCALAWEQTKRVATKLAWLQARVCGWKTTIFVGSVWLNPPGLESSPAGKNRRRNCCVFTFWAALASANAMWQEKRKFNLLLFTIIRIYVEIKQFIHVFCAFFREPYSSMHFRKSPTCCWHFRQSLVSAMHSCNYKKTCFLGITSFFFVRNYLDFKMEFHAAGFLEHVFNRVVVVVHSLSHVSVHVFEFESLSIWRSFLVQRTLLPTVGKCKSIHDRISGFEKARKLMALIEDSR